MPHDRYALFLDVHRVYTVIMMTQDNSHKKWGHPYMIRNHHTVLYVSMLLLITISIMFLLNEGSLTSYAFYILPMPFTRFYKEEHSIEGEYQLIHSPYHCQIIFIQASEKVLIECSDALVAKYNLDDHVFIVSETEFQNLLDNKEDIAMFKHIHLDDMVEMFKERKFKISLPGQQGYLSMVQTGVFPLKKGHAFKAYVSSKATEMPNIVLKEEETVYEHTKDLIIKTNRDGFITHVSNQAMMVLGLSHNHINEHIKNIINQQQDTPVWYDDVLSEGKVEFETNHGSHVVRWHIECVYDDQHHVQSLIAVGHVIDQQLSVTHDDKTTGFLNQTGIMALLEQTQDIKHAHVYYIKVANFEHIIDVYGLLVSQKIIENVAKEIKKCQSHGVEIGRYLDDAFLIYSTTPEITKQTLMSICHNLSKKTYQIDEITIQIDLHAGYAVYPEHSSRVAHLVSLASLAMKANKHEAGALLTAYQPKMGAKLKHDLLISDRLKKAIDEDDIDVHFQNIYDLDDNKVNYVEALARWEDPYIGQVNPEVFLNIAVKNKIIDKLDQALIHKSLAYFKVLHQKSPQLILSLNLTPQTIMKHDIGTFLVEQVHAYALNPASVCLEISEKTFVLNTDVCRSQIRMLKQAGFMIALDDFGKDYSSLAVLESVDFDVIKLDGLFTKNIQLEKNQEIVKMVKKITELSDKDLIIEGVETKKQRDILSKLGCKHQQGFLFHKPEKMV